MPIELTIKEIRIRHRSIVDSVFNSYDFIYSPVTYIRYLGTDIYEKKKTNNTHQAKNYINTSEQRRPLL